MRRALVLGDAACVFADASAALDLSPFEAIAACNNMIVRWQGHLDYAISLHPEPAPDWNGLRAAIKARTDRGFNRPEVWSYKPANCVDRWTPDWAGSTGLLAVKVLLELGFDRIVLAGVPISEAEGHFYDPKPWNAARIFRRGWLGHLEEIRANTRSMSGWTAEQLGMPSAEWLRPE